MFSDATLRDETMLNLVTTLDLEYDLDLSDVTFIVLDDADPLCTYSPCASIHYDDATITGAKIVYEKTGNVDDVKRYLTNNESFEISIGPEFFVYTEDSRLAILMHEIGHKETSDFIESFCESIRLGEKASDVEIKIDDNYIREETDADRFAADLIGIKRMADALMEIDVRHVDNRGITGLLKKRYKALTGTDMDIKEWDKMYDTVYSDDCDADEDYIDLLENLIF